MIHHTAVSHDKNPDQFVAANNYHRSKGFPKSSLGYYIGYNYTISKNGRTHQGRKDGEVTAACPQDGMNSGKCIHICLDGHFDNEKPEAAQIYALRDLIKLLVQEYGITKSHIVFHNQFATKSCPGSNMDLGFVRSFGKDNERVFSIKEQVVKKLEELIDLVNKL